MHGQLQKFQMISSKIVVMSKHKIKKSNAASANHTFPYFDMRYF